MHSAVNFARNLRRCSACSGGSWFIVGTMGLGKMVRACTSDQCSAERDIVPYPKSWIHERAGKEHESAGCMSVVSGGSCNHLLVLFY